MSQFPPNGGEQETHTCLIEEGVGSKEGVRGGAAGALLSHHRPLGGGASPEKRRAVPSEARWALGTTARLKSEARRSLHLVGSAGSHRVGASVDGRGEVGQSRPSLELFSEALSGLPGESVQGFRPHHPPQDSGVMRFHSRQVSRGPQG